MTKKRTRLIRLFVSLLLLVVVVLTGIGHILKHSCAGGYAHPKFKTKYTVEEHIERIEARTRSRYYAEIKRGEIVNFTVEIVYAFYDSDPEYFLVEFEYAETDSSSMEISRRHFLGYIQDDKYYSGLYGYDGMSILQYGESPYAKCGYATAKKYYGGRVFAVETAEGLLQIYESDVDYRQRLISKTEQKELMKNNFKLFIEEY